ncbi:MAG: hypothetical protein J5640_03270 [Bacteroidales bacterium]|nr:hypothetical protein [Bacteroidales bacterium]
MKARFLALFIIPVTIIASCTREKPEVPEDNPEVVTEPADSVWHITIQASKGADTKALYLDTSGGKDVLNAYWKAGEKVKVYNGSSLLGTLDVTPGSGDYPTTATLSGIVSISGLAQGNQLTLLIPRETWNYTGQVGTLESLQSNYDYATATVTINNIETSTNTVSTTAATFNNQQSVYRFAFKKDNADFSIRDFSILSAGNRIVSATTLGGTPTLGGFTVTPASATNAPLFVAICNTGTTDDTYNFIITGSDDALYMATKDIPARVLDVPGKFISAKNINATKSDFAPVDGTTDTAL